LIQWFRLLFQFKLSGDRLDADLPPTAEEYEFAAAATRSEAIDRALQEEATMLRRETKIVLLGNISSGKELIMHQMKSLYAEGFYPEQERMNYRPSVYSVVRRLIQSIIHLLRDTGVTLSSELNHDFAILLHEVETADPQHITPEAVKAVESIWACPRFSKLFIRNSEIEFPQYAPYFARAVARVAEVDYVPSEADIIRLNQSMRGIKELRFSWDELDVHLFNISGYVPQHFRERWYHQLEGATSLIYTIDICLYDKPNPAQPSKSLLETEFASFENWVNEPRFANSSIILLLNNFTRFCKKLHYSPLGSLCSDYTPSESDPEMSARQYLLRRFKGVNHQALSIYSFWVDLDMSDNQHLYAALKKTLTNIQQHKAREKVRNASGTTVDSNRHSANGLSNLSGASRDTLRNKKSIQSEEFV
jgi:guanine nucleotide-binding protein subunit alpha